MDSQLRGKGDSGVCSDFSAGVEPRRPSQSAHSRKVGVAEMLVVDPKQVPVIERFRAATPRAACSRVTLI